MLNLFLLWIKIVLVFGFCSTSEVTNFSSQGESLICGPRFPKTKRRLECEQLHRENLNVARCPFAFPVYVKAHIEDIKFGEEVRSITVRIQLDIRWNISVNEQPTQKPSGASGDEGATRNETCTKAPYGTGIRQWMPQLFVYPSLSSRHSGDQLNIDTGRPIGSETRLSHVLIITAPCKRLDCTWYIGAFQAQNHSVQLFWSEFSDQLDGVEQAEWRAWLVRGLSVQLRHVSGRQLRLLPVVVRLRSQLAPAVMRVQLPSALLVLVGWLLFFTPDELAEARLLAAYLALLAAVRLTAAPPPADLCTLAALGFAWAALAACVVDVDYAFRSLEREQHQSMADVLFFYSQPEAAGEVAGRLRRRRDSLVGGELVPGGQLEVTPAAETVEWSEFYQWAHSRHASRPPPPQQEDAASQWSLQSLIWTLRDISKQYRWIGWAELVRKSAQIMYPVFFCSFVVVYYLLYMKRRGYVATS